MLVAWNDSLSVGHDVIDREHQHLIDLINQLDDAMHRQQGRAVEGEILNELVGYTRDHFAHEERIMRSVGYPAIEAHVLEHQDLRRRVQTMQADHQRGVLSVTEIMQVLVAWLVDHIVASDRQLAAYLTPASVAATS